jgi:4-carboxymuconolactone decarboxylase
MRAPRFPQLDPAALDAAQRKVADEILKVSSGGLGGPYNFLLRSPVLAERTLLLADYLRFNTSVPRRLNELAILIQARLWTAQYEWWAHYPLALKAGLSPAVADELALGKRPAAMQPDEAVVYDFCVELSKRHAVSDATFARARATLGEQQIVDLVALSGFYVMVSMILNAAEARIPRDGEPPLKAMADPLPLP